MPFVWQVRGFRQLAKILASVDVGNLKKVRNDEASDAESVDGLLTPCYGNIILQESFHIVI